jgi:hypothetical protein
MSQRLAAVRSIAGGDRDTAQECRSDSYGCPLAATLNCPAGDWIDRTALTACWFDISITKPACQRADHLRDVSQTSSLWSFARILSEDCSKMLRARLLTTSFPSLKIKN